jgi:hypothetical protein
MIWTTTAQNDYLDFPHAGQAFLIEHERIHKKTGKWSIELAYGITRRNYEGPPSDILYIFKQRKRG